MLVVAGRDGSPAMVPLLRKAGADVNAMNRYGRTALISATMTEDPAPAMVLALLKAGADPSMQDKQGKTALDYARENRELVGTEAIRNLEAASRP